MEKGRRALAGPARGAPPFARGGTRQVKLITADRSPCSLCSQINESVASTSGDSAGKNATGNQITVTFADK